MTPALLIDPETLPASFARPVLALGNFDGMHRGHRVVFSRTVSLAKERDVQPGLLTFEPHPRAFFSPAVPLFRLTPPPIKRAVAGALGLPLLIEWTFDATLAGMTAEDFVEEILIRRLAVTAIVVGHDFHFGKARRGTPEFLTEAGRRLGFDVVVVDALQEGEIPISSTMIRQALEAGHVEEANRLLGYEWFVRATVRHGDKRGRDLGYPTANLALDPACRLSHGIYAVRVTIDGAVHPGVASFGRRPTFDNGAPLLEVHVFDFVGDLYEKTVDVAFVAWLRGEAKFDSIDALIVQMDDDSRRARAVLGA